MKKTGSKLLSLILAAMLIAGLIPSAAFASVGKDTGVKNGYEEISEADEEESSMYTVYAHDGTMTAIKGEFVDGKIEVGSIVVITLDESVHSGYVFDYWKSSTGEIIPKKSFSLLVGQDVCFYPVYKDIEPDFGEWELYLPGQYCEDGDIYVRIDEATGVAEYKIVYFNGGMHKMGEYVYVDEDCCRSECEHCGYVEEYEHNWSSEEVIVEPTHATEGIVKSTCYNCGTEVTRNIGRLEDHVWNASGANDPNWEVITEAKDGQPGIRRRHCLYCDAYEDYWYIRAEWEKYYFGNRIYFDSRDSLGLWGTDDEIHYNFINDDGYETFVYVVREDYRDSDQTWAFMWIDHADELGRKPLYLAKSYGTGEYNIYPNFDWAVVDFVDTKEEFIDEIDHINCGYDRYSSSLFDLFTVYERLYNEAMIPANGSPDFMEHCTWWEYEGGEKVLHKDSYTGIEYYALKYNDSRQFLHIDPKTNVCLENYEPNASYHNAYIKALSAIVRPDEYDAIYASFEPDITENIVPVEYPEVDTSAGEHEHDFDWYVEGTWQTVDNINHVQFCKICGEPQTSTHTYWQSYYVDLDDLKHAHKKSECNYCGFVKSDEPILLSTAQISDDIYNSLNSSYSGRSLRVNVLNVPDVKNFQIRVAQTYCADGPNAGDYNYTDYFRWHGSVGAWNYGYYNSDWSNFGVVRTLSTPKDYMNYNGGDTFFVEPIGLDVENYVFSHWEKYNWTTDTWEFYSNEESPRLNYVEWDYNLDNPTEFTVDTRVNDLTLFRCVHVYSESEPEETVHIKVHGGTYNIISTNGTTYCDSEGDVSPGSWIFPLENYDEIPDDKQFEGWRMVQNGQDVEIVWNTYNYSQYIVIDEDTEFFPLYVDKKYYLDAYADNGYVYLDGEEYYGGEYEAGTALTFTTEGFGVYGEDSEESYEYFYGWYVMEEGGKEEMGGKMEEILLSMDTTLEYIVPAGYSRIIAKWGATAEQPVDYHDITVTNGFVCNRSMMNGVLVSDLRVDDYSSIEVYDNPSDLLEVDLWTLSGTLDDGTDVNETCEPTYGSGSFWIGDNNESPHLITINGTGQIIEHEHIYGEPEWIWRGTEYAAAKFTCTDCIESMPHTEIVVAEITQETSEDGKTITYTATAEFEGMEYTDTKTDQVMHHVYIEADAGCVVDVFTDATDEEGGTPLEGSEALVAHGTVVSVDASAKTGYELVTIPDAEYTVNDDIVISALSRLLTYSLTLTHENGPQPTIGRPGEAEINPEYVYYGSVVTVTAADPEEGYEFIGWYFPNGKLVTTDKEYTFTMTSDVALEAKYQAVSGVVTFVANNNIQKTITAASVTEADFPADPYALDGYEFDGWDKTVGEINSALSHGDNVTVSAKYKEKEVNITLTIYNGESDNPVIKYYSTSTVVKFTADEVEGKQFAYWMLDDMIISYNETASFRVTEDSTLTAVYSTDEVEKSGTAVINKATYNGTTKKLTFAAYLTVPENAVINAAGIAAASANSKKYSAGTELTIANADYAKSYAAAVGTNADVNYTWTKTHVNPGDVWYTRAYVTYTVNSETTTVYSELLETTAGNDYDINEKGSAVIKSVKYNATTKKASFNAYLTLPKDGVIIKAGLVAVSGADFNPKKVLLTADNADYVKTLASAEGTNKDVSYTWTKTKVNPGDIWYVRAYLVYRDAEGNEHTLYGELVALTAE